MKRLQVIRRKAGKMESVALFFSSALEKATIFRYEGMNIKMGIEGYDEELECFSLLHRDLK